MAIDTRPTIAPPTAVPTEGGGRAPHRSSRLPWFTIGLLAALLAYADGFWVVSLQGSVGAVERAGTPFASWLRNSSLMLPVFALAVTVAFVLAARRFGPGLRGAKAVTATAGLVLVAGTLVGLGQTTGSAALDYRLQSALIQRSENAHSASLPQGQSFDPGSCVGVCAAQRETLRVHAKGIGYAGIVLLLTNLLLVGWVVAARGGRLGPAAWGPWVRLRRRMPARD